MQITATELKANLGKYLKLAETEDIQITKNGRETVKLSGSNKDLLKTIRSVYGILPDDASVDDARQAMISKELGYNI